MTASRTRGAIGTAGLLACVSLPLALLSPARSQAAEPPRTVVEDTAFSYSSGNFFQEPSAGASGGTVHVGWVAGDHAEYTFTGTRVAVHGPTPAQGSDLSGAIDGRTVANRVPTRGAADRALLWQSGQLPAGDHTIRITTLGDWIEFDHLVIEGSGSPTPPPTPRPEPPGWNLRYANEFDDPSNGPTQWYTGEKAGTTWAGSSQVEWADGYVRNVLTDLDGTDTAGTGGDIVLPDMFEGRYEVRLRFPPGCGSSAYMGLYPVAENRWPPELMFAEDYPEDCSKNRITQYEMFRAEASGNTRGVNSPPSDGCWTYRYDDSPNTNCIAKAGTQLNASDWHTYVFEVDGGRLRAFVDGVPTLDHEIYSLREPLKIGWGVYQWRCEDTSKPCFARDADRDETSFDIDYVRIYQR